MGPAFQGRPIAFRIGIGIEAALDGERQMPSLETAVPVLDVFPCLMTRSPFVAEKCLFYHTELRVLKQCWSDQSSSLERQGSSDMELFIQLSYYAKH